MIGKGVEILRGRMEDPRVFLHDGIQLTEIINRYGIDEEDPGALAFDLNQIVSVSVAVARGAFRIYGEWAATCGQPR